MFHSFKVKLLLFTEVNAEWMRHFDANIHIHLSVRWKFNKLVETIWERERVASAHHTTHWCINLIRFGFRFKICLLLNPTQQYKLFNRNGNIINHRWIWIYGYTHSVCCIYVECREFATMANCCCCYYGLIDKLTSTKYIDWAYSNNCV